ncbi:MAG: FliM/FliN family flagellar motor switch protein [Deltaproteobacteria bacterium]|nr:FliM/FliN family flagellar motor switch protein [Deltaproteobacteria bacterium]
MLKPLTQAKKLAKLGSRSLTRAHVALQRRPALKAAFAEAVQAVATALGKRLDAEVTLESQLLDAAVKGPNSLASPGVFALVSLDEVGGFAVVELEPQLCSALVDKLAGGNGESLAPLALSEAERAGTSLLVLDALAALRNSPVEKALGPRLVRIVTSAAEVTAVTDLRAAHLAVRVKLSCGPATGFARVLIPASALRFWVESVPAEVVVPAPEVAAASVPVSVIAGRATLTTADIDTLTGGDVVLLEGLSGTREALTGPARLVGTTFAITGHIGPDAFTVAALHTEPAMNDATTIQKAPELPVEVEVELCKVRLTVAELGALQVGGVIPLRVGAGEPVALKLGDAVVAIAELVEIEGEIGARILRLAK